MFYGVFVTDREPTDTMLGNPTNPTDKTVELTDRDDNRYLATLVLSDDSYAEATKYVKAGYETGSVRGRFVDNDRIDGNQHEVHPHGLVILELAKRPHAGSPLKFRD